MRMLILVLSSWLTVAVPALAQDQPADEAIIRELMVVTETAKLMDGMNAQVDNMMKQAMADALGGKAMTPEQQALFDEMRDRIIAILRDSMSWAKFEPIMIDIYRKSFTRAEVQGMLDFYKSDAGRAVVAKMPLVMQHTMALMNEHMRAILPKVQDVQKDIIARLRALDQKAAPTT